ncbi:MAG: 3-hydroxyacyl-CoA dehydrogenase NAD-binding domain-containing protein, partial [Anaerolineaceae bacterium]
MSYKVHQAVVLGAGTMGAAIAAHLANAGIPVTLLDIIPNKLTPEEVAKGLSLDDAQVRNRIVRQGYDRAVKAKPANFFTPDHTALIKIGNMEDDIGAVAKADWVIEAVVENLKIKQAVMQRIDELRAHHTIVSTNTSGIPIESIAQGLSEGIRQH